MADESPWMSMDVPDFVREAEEAMARGETLGGSYTEVTIKFGKGLVGDPFTSRNGKEKLETDAAGSRKAKLRFEKAEFTEIERPSVAKHMASRGAAVTLTSKAHQAVSEYEDDNIGVQAVQETTKAVESTAYTVDHAVYSH